MMNGIISDWAGRSLGSVLVLLTSHISAAAGGSFRFAEVNEKSLGLWEGDKPVFVYNHGVLSKPGVPADRNRSTYLHPIHGLDGEVLTDDFPKDHYHHRGLFWGWPQMRVGKEAVDLWALKGIEHRFERWLGRECTPTEAVLGVENGWYMGNQKVAQEQVRMRVHPAGDEGRLINVELMWVPLNKPITLQGAEGKSYGGLSLRFAPRTDTVITTPKGQGKDDLHITRLPWADLSARFDGRTAPSGVTIFIGPDHPDYPPEWLTRHYGVLCVGWPGVNAKTFQPGETIRCRYGVWIHRGAPDVKTVQQAYDRFRSQNGGKQ